ncbi:hypothetical protein Poli38472_010107 [Pythium oligandrum]|uniref:Ankyrin repeat protein n=1 Tax=Pythium oligandrum TaxID=41045 RepID=A0A8K1C8V4_PYTOL|nr:hypothetical protein Poli38472_010107 [Pythium oligandrum]|eukprot:TMW58548.1 hypothetical protein Poli38472_010107 [Pythium oligandrum]
MPGILSLASVLEAEWFYRELVSFLTHEDAICLAVMATECNLKSLRHALLYKSLPIRPIQIRELVNYTAERGWWHLVAPLMEEDPQTRYKRDPTASDVKESALTRCQRIQPHYQHSLSAEAINAAVRRGSLEEVQWLYKWMVGPDSRFHCTCWRSWSCEHYKLRLAFGCAQDAHQWEVLEWLMDYTANKTSIVVKTELRFEDPSFQAVCWRKGPSHYFIISDRELFPNGRAFYSEPMDWAAARGDLKLLKKLHSDPGGTTMCSHHAMIDAAKHGHLNAVRWLHRFRTEHLDKVPEVLMAARKSNHIHILEWLRANFDLKSSIPSTYKEAAIERSFDVLRWIISHFRDIVSKLEPPRPGVAADMPLDLFQLLCEVHEVRSAAYLAIPIPIGFDRWGFENLRVDFHNAKEAADSGNFEVVRWIVEEDFENIVPTQERRNDLLWEAIRGANFELVQWCVEELGAWLTDGAFKATKDECTPVAKYLCMKARERAKEHDAPSIQEVQASQTRVLKEAIHRRNLELVQWCVEELGAWHVEALSWAASHGDLAMFKYLVAKEEERGETEAMAFLEQNGVDCYRILDIIHDRKHKLEEEMLDWILLNCADTRIEPDEDEMMWLEPEPWQNTRKMLQHRPSKCLWMEDLPMFAVGYGSLADLQRLEAIGHPGAFTEKTLDAILKLSRDEAAMHWFLTGCGSTRVDWRIVRWAAKYAAVQILEMQQEMILGLDNVQSEQDEDESRRRFLGIVLWTAIRYDQVEVLSWGGRQDCSERLITRLWTFTLAKVATQCGSIDCMAWLYKHGMITSNELIMLRETAAEYGQIRCLDGISSLASNC